MEVVAAAVRNTYDVLQVSIGTAQNSPTLLAGFEPARGDPNGFLVHRLNHSATTTPSLCAWVMNLVTDRPQQVRVSKNTSYTLTTCTPQVCMLSPMLFTLFKHTCTPVHFSNNIINLLMT